VPETKAKCMKENTSVLSGNLKNKIGSKQYNFSVSPPSPEKWKTKRSLL